MTAMLCIFCDEAFDARGRGKTCSKECSLAWRRERDRRRRAQRRPTPECKAQQKAYQLTYRQKRENKEAAP